MLQVAPGPVRRVTLCLPRTLSLPYPPASLPPPLPLLSPLLAVPCLNPPPSASPSSPCLPMPPIPLCRRQPGQRGTGLDLFPLEFPWVSFLGCWRQNVRGGIPCPLRAALPLSRLPTASSFQNCPLQDPQCALPVPRGPSLFLTPCAVGKSKQLPAVRLPRPSLQDWVELPRGAGGPGQREALGLQGAGLSITPHHQEPLWLSALVVFLVP